MTTEAERIGRVRVSDPDHPHFGEAGVLTGRVIRVIDEPMAEVRLEDCRHGTEGCFVKKGQITKERRALKEWLARRK